jgi:beta-fructofuranosidase
VEYKNVTVEGNVTLPGIEGRVLDMEITIRPKDKDAMYRKFGVWFAQNEKFKTTLSYKPYESTLKIDRKCSGSRRAYIHQRRSLIPYRDGEVKMRLILDKYSVEVFVNDGEQVMTATFMTTPEATGISFFADGQVEMDITKYDLFVEE